VVSFALRLILDVAAVFAAFVAAAALQSVIAGRGWLAVPVVDPAAEVGFACLFADVLVLVFLALELYHPRTSVLNLWETQRTLKGVPLAATLFLAILFTLELPVTSRFYLGLAIAVTLVTVMLERRLVVHLSRHLVAGLRRERRTLIAGCGAMGRLLMKKILDAPHTDRHVVGFVDGRFPAGERIRCCTDQATGRIEARAVLGPPAAVGELVRRHRIDELLIDEAALDAATLDRLLAVATRTGVEIGIVPEFGDHRADQLYLEDLAAVPVLRPYRHEPSLVDRAMKRALDVVGALTLLVLAAPFMALAALALRIQNRGSVLFSQERVGLDGVAFRILKFRTMHASASPYAYSPASDDDPRVTAVGRILRTSGFDELPQLFNILRGEMSLVGPRPEMPFIVSQYTPLQCERLRVKPGLTGIWQLSPDRNAQIHENIEYDFYYIHHRTLTMDLLIMLETAFCTVEMALRRLARRPVKSEEPAPVSGDRVRSDELSSDSLAPSPR
jgi:exopolysaccharide biosynthesis polyprenyl glycosylphosphotransferase